ncbi:hypothetical protein [Methylobacterium sp. 285MFTsu5.1]|uniref:hypothetical protein n=1 Tax=Methylobacterium sp. 285MFTsu5.1 TaxID=1172187 RepID=UPI00131A41C2|nr:hypothetical protein [Methylobacterium sp. 285MFTsu5.1]
MAYVKVAVFLRTNKFNEKTISSIDCLSGSQFFDFFVLANETAGELHFPGVKKISHTVETVCNEIEYVNNEEEMILYSDALFKFIKNRLPDYDYYIMVEDDVHFVSKSSLLIDKIVIYLSDNNCKVDLFASWYRDINSTKEYARWSDNCFKTFNLCVAIFFPLVGLSSRAIDQLDKNRELENANPDRERHLVFCELSVPTALRVAGEFVIKDINEMIPNAYSHDTFKFGLPELLDSQKLTRTGVEMLHPVYDIKGGIAKHYHHAEHTGEIEAFLKFLAEIGKPLSDPVIADFALRALIAIAVRSKKNSSAIAS